MDSKTLRVEPATDRLKYRPATASLWLLPTNDFFLFRSFFIFSSFNMTKILFLNLLEWIFFFFYTIKDSEITMNSIVINSCFCWFKFLVFAFWIILIQIINHAHYLLHRFSFPQLISRTRMVHFHTFLPRQDKHLMLKEEIWWALQKMNDERVVGPHPHVIMSYET